MNGAAVRLFRAASTAQIALRDPSTGDFYGLAARESDKDVCREMYRAVCPHPDDVAFERTWPFPWLLQDCVYAESFVIAFLDTGLMQEHPMMCDGSVQSAVDLTGEGMEDRDGHGTWCILLTRMRLPGVPEGRILVLKVVPSKRRALARYLIDGLDWLTQYQQRHPQTRVTASVSCGLYSKRWLLFDCNGTCAVCRAARRAARAGVLIGAAAGNTPGKTACPARAAFIEPGISAFATSEPTSGIGTVVGESLLDDPPLRAVFSALPDPRPPDQCMGVFEAFKTLTGVGDEIAGEFEIRLVRPDPLWSVLLDKRARRYALYDGGQLVVRLDQLARSNARWQRPSPRNPGAELPWFAATRTAMLQGEALARADDVFRRQAALRAAMERFIPPGTDPIADLRLWTPP